MSIPAVSGFALLCDKSGMVERVVYDELGVTESIRPGQHFPRLVDRGSLGKALNFLVAVQGRQAAFDWEINMPLRDRVIPLHFSGAEVDGRLLLVGARSHDDALKLYDEMALIANTEANTVRQALKDQIDRERSGAHTNDDLMDQLSRLNNELTGLQRELSKKNEELERLNVLKNQFLGMAAHDLRNPLGLIMAYSDFLIQEAGPQLGEEHNEFLDIIHNSSRFMLKLVNDLLDVSVIESGNLTLDLQGVDLAALVSQVVALNRSMAAKKQITIDLAAGEPLMVLCDPVKIEQVLNNLLTNAVKFSFPQTQIEIAVALVDQQAQITVRDHGQGIPPADLGKLFKPFSRTSVRTTGGEKSTGLGLLITRRIIEEHHGRIWVESEVGVGTAFHVALPLKEPS